jgi:hypothetical protein
MVEELRGGQACSGLRLRRDTSLVTTTQVLTASFELLSKWSELVVCCVGCVCLWSGDCSCGGGCFDALCINASSS